MAQYQVNFGADTAGSPPSGFTERWETAYTSWSVATESGASGGQVLTQSASYDRETIFSWDSLDSSEDVELYFRLKFHKYGAYSSPPWGFRVAFAAVGNISGPDEASSAEAAELRFDEQLTTAYVYAHKTFANGGETLIGSTAFASTLSNDTYYRLRVRYEPGASPAAIKFKIWADGDSEPGTWTTHASSSLAGFTGVWYGFGVNNRSSRLTATYDWITAATDGGTAPTYGEAPVYPETGELLLSGYSPALSNPLFPSSGSLNYTGYSPEVVVFENIFEPSYGVIEITGYAPHVTYGNVATGSASFEAMNAAGSCVVPGYGKASFAHMTSSGRSAAFGSASFEAITVSGVGYSVNMAEGSASFEEMTASGTSIQTQIISGAALFEAMTASSGVTQIQMGYGSAHFQAIEASGIGSQCGYGMATFNPMTANGVATQGQVIDGAASFSFLRCWGRGISGQLISGSASFEPMEGWVDILSTQTADGEASFVPMECLGFGLQPGTFDATTLRYVRPS